MEVSRKEFDDLRNLVLALIKRIDNDKYYDSTDKNGIRQTEGQHSEAINGNTASTIENDTAICDVAELSDVNSTAIDDLAEMVDELMNRVSELEEQNG